MSSPSKPPGRPEGAAPTLLVAFFGAVLVMVGAVVVIGRTGSDLADIGAFALMLALVAAMAALIARQLRADDE